MPRWLLGLGAFRVSLLAAPGFPEGGEVTLPLTELPHGVDVLHKVHLLSFLF